MSLRRSQWINLALVAAAIIGVIVVVATGRRVTTAERESRTENVLPAYRADDLTRLVIQNEGQRIVVTRSAGDDAGTYDWAISEPIQEDAEPYAVDKLLGSLEYARFIRRIDAAEVDRERMGLDSPVRTVTVHMGEIQYELRVGAEAAAPSGARYLELIAKGAPGSGVMLISRDLATELDVDLAELRERLLIPYTSGALERIVLAGSGGTRKLKALPGNRWRFDGMQGGVRVDRALFDIILTQFARTNAEHFLSAAEAKKAQVGAETVTIEMFPKDRKRPAGQLIVGGPCPKSDNDVVALRTKPDVQGACVPKSVMPALATPAERLIDKSPFSARPDEIESLVMTMGKDRLELHREGDGFVLRAPVEGRVQLDLGNRFLERIVGAEGTVDTEADAKKHGLAPARGKLTLTYIGPDDTSTIKDTVEIGEREPSGALWLRRTQDNALLRLEQEVARPFRVDGTLLRSPELLSFSPSTVEAIEITGKGPAQRVVREASGQFNLEKPKGYDADTTLAIALVDALGSLRAERWVADKDDGSFGFKDPFRVVRIELADSEGATHTRTLTIGGPTAGGAYGKLSDESGVFVIGRSVVDTVSTLLIDRASMLIAPERVEHFELEHEGKKWKLARRGESWQLDAGPELPTASIQRLGEALTNLRADAAIHLGAATPAEGLAQPVVTVRVQYAGDDRPDTIRIGSGDSWRNTAIHYARITDVDATFVIARSRIKAILVAL